MFIVSMKTSVKKIVAYFFLGLIFLSVLVVFFVQSKGYKVSAKEISDVYLKTNQMRVEYFSAYGWKVENEPLEILDVLIPSEFNDTYKKYNEMQKEQGFNLEDYSNKRCKRYTYAVLNYPNNDNVRATLLLCEDKVIGGDIHTVELDGFMHGFSLPKNRND